jgi:hypothetical protein
LTELLLGANPIGDSFLKKVSTAGEVVVPAQGSSMGLILCVPLTSSGRSTDQVLDRNYVN